MSLGAKFLMVLDTFASYCQVCRQPRVVGRIAVPGWQYHGLICSHCLRELADEVERRGEGLAVDPSRNTEALAVLAGGNGHAR